MVGRGEEQVTDGLEKAEMRISQGTIAISNDGPDRNVTADMEKEKAFPLLSYPFLQMFTGGEMH